MGTRRISDGPVIGFAGTAAPGPPFTTAILPGEFIRLYRKRKSSSNP